MYKVAVLIWQLLKTATISCIIRQLRRFHNVAFRTFITFEINFIPLFVPSITFFPKVFCFRFPLFQSSKINQFYSWKCTSQSSRSSFNDPINPHSDPSQPYFVNPLSHPHRNHSPLSAPFRKPSPSFSLQSFPSQLYFVNPHSLPHLVFLFSHHNRSLLSRFRVFSRTAIVLPAIILTGKLFS